ncbi:unnamed protein product [Aphanomyces euteiches]
MIWWLVFLLIHAIDGDVALPRPNVLNSIGSVGATQTIPLRADIVIPDGREVFVPIHVPPVSVGINAKGPAKVASVNSLHANGRFGVGEVIDIDVQFTSPVDVVGTPSLRMLTGCHAPSCRVKEIQSITCWATSGEFGVSFLGETVSNIPYDATPLKLRNYLLRLTSISALTITYDAGTKACTFRGTTITIQFDLVNSLGVDGDLPSLQLDPLNLQGDKTALSHHTFPVVLTPVAVEVQKGFAPIDRDAPFVGFRNPSTLIFRYTVAFGDISTDLDYASTDSIWLNAGGAIYNAGTTVPAALGLPVPGRAPTWPTGMTSSLSINRDIVVDSTIPTITAVSTTTPDGIYGTGEVIEIMITFSLPVAVVGAPTLLLATGVNVAQARIIRIQSGGLVLVAQYIVGAGDFSLDLTYIDTTSFVLNAGDSVKRLSTNPTTNANMTLPPNGLPGSLFTFSNLVIDTTPPYIVSIACNQPNGVYTTGDTLTFQLVYSRLVVVTGLPQFKVATGTIDLSPGYFVVRVPTNGNQNVFMFPEQVDWSWLQPGFAFVVGGSTFTVASITGYQITTNEAYTGPAVNLGTDPSSPRLAIQTRGFRYAVYRSGSGSSTLQFAYTVQHGDTSSNLATASDVLLPTGSSILRQSTTPTTPCQLSLPAAGTLGSLDTVSQLVINTGPATVVGISTPTRGGVYSVGNTLAITVQFSQPVAVVGPTLPGLLTNVGENRFALYASGSGTSSLVFQLTVEATDQAATFGPLSADTIRMPNVFTSIRRKSMQPMDKASLTLPTLSLGATTLTVDPTAAIVTQIGVFSPTATVFRPGDLIVVAVVFSQQVTVTGQPLLDLSIGVPAVYASGSGTDTLSFQYTVQYGDSSLQFDIASLNAIRLNGGSIVAVATAKPACLTILGMSLAGSGSPLTIDPSPFRVVKVNSWTIDGVYTLGDTLLIAVVFSDTVVASGTPQLWLRTGNPGGDQVANLHSYVDNLVYFTYAVQTGDSTRRVVESSTLALRCANDVGLNANPLQDATAVSSADWAGKLVTCWSEQSKIRVSVFNNDQNMPLWTTLSTGLNADPTQTATGCSCLTVGVQLVCAWQETTAGGNSVVHVSVMTGSISSPAWTLISGAGVNFDLVKAASTVTTTVSSTGSLVVAWQEMTTNGQTTLRIKSWNGNLVTPVWTSMDMSTLAATSNHQNADLGVLNNQIILSWTEVVSGTISKLHVSSYSGGVWTALDGGNGLNAASRVAVSSSVSFCSSKLYVAWFETSAGAGYIRVQVFNTVGSIWSFIDGGSGVQSSNAVGSVSLACFQNNLVAAWQELSSGVILTRAATYSGVGNTWSPAGVSNDNVLQSASWAVLTVSSNVLYMTWSEVHINTKAQVRAAVFTPQQIAWSSLIYSCLKRAGAAFLVPFGLRLPPPFSQNSLGDTSQLQLDTVAPSIIDIRSLSTPGLYQLKDTAQTIAVVAPGSTLTGGSFSLGYNNAFSSCVAWNAAAIDLENALEAIPGLSLDVTVTKSATAFLHGSLFQVAFNVPATGLHAFTLGTGCSPLVCASGLACGQVLVNPDKSSVFPTKLQPGYVDFEVRFTSPVQVTGAAPVLTLTTGVIATYQSGPIYQIIDVAVGAPSRVVAGGFALSYGGVNTACIDIQAAQGAGAILETLLAVPAIATIGIVDVKSDQFQNGLRYKIQFQPGAPSALAYSPSVTCPPLVGLIQTIDLVASAPVTAGSFAVGVGTYVSATCLPYTTTAANLQTALNALTNQEVQVLVQKRPIPSGGYRFTVTFPNTRAALYPLTLTTAGCTPLACAGGTCSFVVNAEYTVAIARTPSLVFRYSVQPGDTITSIGYTSLTGGIQRASASPGIPASLALPAKLSPSGIQVNTLATATITSVTSSTLDGVYSQGDLIFVALTFSKVVLVKGQPSLELTSNGIALFKSGNNSQVLTFQYTVGASETTSDLDCFSPWSLQYPNKGSGIYFVDPTTSGLSPAATILPVTTDPASLSSHSNIVIDAVVPTVQVVSSIKAAGTYAAGEAIDILVQFSHSVMVTGTPTILLNSGGAASFTYAGQRQLIDVGVKASTPIVSGQYAVWYGGILSECITFNDLNMLQAKLLDLPGIAAIGIASVTASTLGNGKRIVITFGSPNAFSAPLELVPTTPPQCLPLIAGRNDVLLVSRGLDNFVTFRYTVQTPDATLALGVSNPLIQLNGGYIRRRSDHPSINVNPTLVQETFNAIQVNGAVPTIVQVTVVTAGGTYGVAYPPQASPNYVKPGQILFTLTFSQAVVFINTITIQMNTGNFARFYSQLSPTQFSFVYTIQAGDKTPSLDFASPVSLQGTIVAKSTTNSQIANTQLPLMQLTGANIIAIDSTLPTTIISVTTNHPDGTFGAGEVINILTTFGRPVRVLSGLNHNSLVSAQSPFVTTSNGVMYIAWSERLTPSVSILLVAQFDGTVFQELNPVGGLNRNTVNGNAQHVSLIVFNNQLYAAWDEDGVINVAKFSGNVVTRAWTYIFTMGTNENQLVIASSPRLVEYLNTLFLVWREYQNGAPNQVNIRVASYDNTLTPPWYSYDDGRRSIGLNQNRSTDPYAFGFAGHLYIAWAEHNGQRYSIQVQALSLSTMTFEPIPRVGSDKSAAYDAIGPKLFAIGNQLMVQWYSAENKFIMHTGVVTPQYWKEIVQNSTTEGFAPDVQTCNGQTIVAYTARSAVSKVLWTANLLSNGNVQPMQTVNHNLIQDVADFKLACQTSGYAVVWTEFDGMSYKLRLSTSPLGILAWTESTAGLPTIQLSSGLVAVNTDKNGSCVAGLTFQLVVPSNAPLIPQLNVLSFQSNRASLLDCKTNVAVDTTLFPAATDERSLAYSSHIAIDTSPPTVLDVLTTLLSASYGAGQVIPIVVLFSQPVVVSPWLSNGDVPTWIIFRSRSATIYGELEHKAVYSFGNGTNTLTFLYTTLPSDSFLLFDYMLTTSLQVALSSWIRRLSTLPTTDVQLTLPLPGSAHSLSRFFIAIDTTPPVVLDVSASKPDGTYYSGDVIPIVVTFSLPVMATGTPVLYLNTRQTPFQSQALYVGGNMTTQLTFNYIVQPLDQIARLTLYDDRPTKEFSFVKALDSFDGYIYRVATYPTTKADLVCPPPGTSSSLRQLIALDSKVPTVVGVTTSFADGTYDIGTVIPIQVLFSAPVVVTGAPLLILNVNSDGTRGAPYLSGSGSATLVFQYTVEMSDSASPLNYLNAYSLLLKLPVRLSPLQAPPYAAIMRASSHPSLPANLTLPPFGPAPQVNTPPDLIRSGRTIKIRTDGFRVARVDTTTPNGTYAAGQAIQIFVRFTGQVNVVGTPQLILNVPTAATFTSGSGTSVLSFLYVVAAGDVTAALDVNKVRLGTGITVQDLNGGDVPLQLPSAGAKNSLSDGASLAISAIPPVVTSIQSSGPNGVCAAGDIVQITIVFSVPVVATGVPQLSLNTGQAALYSSGSGTSVLVFVYTVVAGNTGVLDYTSTNALTGNIKAVSTTPTMQATLTLPAPGTAGSLSVSANLILNTQAPTVVRLSFAGAPDQVCPVGMVLPILIDFSYPVAVSGVPTLLLATKGNSDRSAIYSGGSGTKLLYFTYTVQAGDAAIHLDYRSVNALQGTVLQMSSAPVLPAILTLPAPGSMQSLSGQSRMIVCTLCPQVVSVSGPPSTIYTAGDILSLVVTFSEAVQFDPAVVQPMAYIRLAMALERAANYVSGSGTTTWTFTYTIQQYDDVYPVEVANARALFGTRIVSVAAPNLQAAIFLPAPGQPNSLSSMSSIRIDTTPPKVVQVTTPTPDGVYGPGHVIPIDVMFSTRVAVTGTPTLLLGLLPAPLAAVYNAAGSTAQTIRFIYTVQTGDNVFRLDYMRVCSDSSLFDKLEGYDTAASGLACLPLGSISALQLNGGSIKAAATVPTVDANLGLPAVNPWPLMRYLNSNASVIYSRKPPTPLSSIATSICIFMQEEQLFLILANGFPNHPAPPGITTASYLVEIPRFPSISFARKRPNGMVGIMINGVPFNNSASAPLVQDACGGALDPITSRYYYVGLPTCLVTDASQLVGYAMDGFPVYSMPPPNQALDECNGIVGIDGVYKYYLNPSSIQTTGTFLPCFKGAVATTSQLQVVVTEFNFVGGIEGFSPSRMNLQDLLITPLNREGGSVWFNDVSVSTTSSTLIITSTGVPTVFGPFPNPLNPNTVKPQNYQFRIPRSPTKATTPIALPLGIVGVMLDGVPFYNTLNADGNSLLDVRVPNHLTLDKCNGYVDASGAYRYYGPPDCLLDQLKEVAGQPSPLIGYALDGYPVFGRFDETGNKPTLDRCNGRVNLNGKYQYHVSDTSPYTIGCFSGVLPPSSVTLYDRSLSTSSAITIDSTAPYITDITTLKAPGVFVTGEIIDLRVLWSAPVVITGTPTLTLSVVNNVTGINAIATYDPTTSSSQTSVFIYQVGAAEFSSDVSVASSTALQLPAGATIKRAATTPTLNAILTCPTFTLGARIQTIASVQVNVLGLYHPDARDLSAYLVHNDVRARLFDPIPMTANSYRFGRPPDTTRRPDIEDAVSGIGSDMSFAKSHLGMNLALQGIATQSSTFGTSGIAAHAIDGVRSAYFSSLSVARTSGEAQRDPVPWWQLRLNKPSPIGTIKLFGVQQQRSQFEVQVIAVTGPIPVDGTFALAVGAACTTPPISVQAPAMRRDETIFGESLQAKLEQCTGEVTVTRSSVPDRMGGYSWTVTFVQDVGTISLMNVVQATQPTLEASVSTLFDSTDNIWYSYQTNLTAAFEKALFPCYVMIFDAMSVMAFESVQDALAAAIWSRFIPSGTVETTIVVPQRPTGQYIRIQHNTPQYLSLAEVEVYADCRYTLSTYYEGSPVAPLAYLENNFISWAPEVSMSLAFGGQSSRGGWFLVVQDLYPSVGQLGDAYKEHGEGGLSEWQLVVTNTAGTTMQYYMALTARVSTIPKYGDLLVDITERETDNLDSDINNYLDPTEAKHYLTTYWPNFIYLSPFVQYRVLQDVLDTYATTGRLKVVGQQGQLRWIAETCEGCTMPPTHLELYNSATVAERQHILSKSRTVQYIPSTTFVGMDDFTYISSVNDQDIQGLVRIQVLNCRDSSCAYDLYMTKCAKP